MSISSQSSISAASSSIDDATDDATEMVVAMEEEAAALGQESEKNTVDQMIMGNADVQAQIATLDSVNEQMTQIMQQEQKEERWGKVGDFISGVIGLCLMPFDPALGIAMITGQGLGLSGLTQDIIGWMSDELQDMFSGLDSQWAKAISDVIFVAAIVVGAVVLGVLTAGVADEAIAGAVVEDAAVEITEDVTTDILTDVGEDATKDVTSSIVDDAVGDVADKAATPEKSKSKLSPGQKRAKRGAKFAVMLGSQAAMHTNVLPNIVAAFASTSANPDSSAWKWAEFGAFIVELATCLTASIATCFVEAPSKVSESFKGSSTYTKVRQAAHATTIGLNGAQFVSDSIAGGYGIASATNTEKMANSASNMIELTAMSDMNNELGTKVNQDITALEESIFSDQDLAHILTGYQVIVA